MEVILLLLVEVYTVEINKNFTYFLRGNIALFVTMVYNLHNELSIS